MLYHRAIAAMSMLDIDSARKVYINDVRAKKMTATNLEALGFEPVDESGPVTKDGREVVRVRGRAWALRPEVHAEMLAAAFAEKKAQRKESSSHPGEALTSVRCPACQSVMAKSPVCPGCAKGRAGFKILCICTECNHEVYL